MRRVQTCWGWDHEVVAAKVWHGLVGGQVSQQLGCHSAGIICHKRLCRVQAERLCDAGVGRLNGNVNVEVQPCRVYLIALLLRQAMYSTYCMGLGSHRFEMLVVNVMCCIFLPIGKVCLQESFM